MMDKKLIPQGALFMVCLAAVSWDFNAIQDFMKAQARDEGAKVEHSVDVAHVMAAHDGQFALINQRLAALEQAVLQACKK